MSDKIVRQSVECDGCGKEFRRNQAVIGHGAEYPNFAKENDKGDEQEIILCSECGENIT